LYPDYDGFTCHKKKIEEKLADYKSNPPIWSKYAWAANYHNTFCDLHSNWFSDEHRIDVDLYRAKPSLIIE